MAHFNRTRSAGTWNTGSAVTQAEFEDLDSKTERAINGDDGGTWSPSSPIIIGGSGVSLRDTPLESRRGVIDPTPFLNWSYKDLVADNQFTAFAFTGEDWVFSRGNDTEWSRLSLDLNSEVAETIDDGTAFNPARIASDGDGRLLALHPTSDLFTFNGTRGSSVWGATPDVSGLVALPDGRFLALSNHPSGNEFAFAVSNSGSPLTWSNNTQTLAGRTTVLAYEMAASSSYVVMTGQDTSDGTRLMLRASSSADFSGSPWTESTLPGPSLGAPSSISYCSVSEQWVVATGPDLSNNHPSALYVSGDGLSWSELSMFGAGTTRSIFTINCFNGIWVAGYLIDGNRGVVVSLDLGATWFKAPLSESGSGLKFGGGRLVNKVAGGIRYTPIVAGLVTPQTPPLG